MLIFKRIPASSCLSVASQVNLNKGLSIIGIITMIPTAISTINTVKKSVDELIKFSKNSIDEYSNKEGEVLSDIK